MVEVRRVEKISKYSPNVITVINAPELQIPTRGYIFANDIDKTFGSLEKAIEYFIERMNKIPKVKEKFQIGFVFGNNYFDKDIFVYPFEISEKDPSKIRSEPYIIKNGIRQCWPIRNKIDEFVNLLDDEQKNLRSKGLEAYKKKFPKLSRLKYE